MTGRDRLVALLTLLGALATVAIWPILGHFDSEMRHSGGYGIIQLELASDPELVSAMLDHWGDTGRQAARRSLHLDFVFIPAYVLLVAGICYFFARNLSGWWARLGTALVPAPVLAGVADVVENILLLEVLDGGTPVPPLLPSAASTAAAFKFALLAVVLVYWVLGGLAWGVERLRSRLG